MMLVDHAAWVGSDSEPGHGHAGVCSWEVDTETGSDPVLRTASGRSGSAGSLTDLL